MLLAASCALAAGAVGKVASPAKTPMQTARTTFFDADRSATHDFIPILSPTRRHHPAYKGKDAWVLQPDSRALRISATLRQDFARERINVT